MIQIFNSNACYASDYISKNTVIGSFQEGTRTRTWLESLRNQQWVINSFIPHKQLVCADVTSDSGIITHLAITLPLPINKSFW